MIKTKSGDSFTIQLFFSSLCFSLLASQGFHTFPIDLGRVRVRLVKACLVELSTVQKTSMPINVKEMSEKRYTHRFLLPHQFGKDGHVDT